MSVFIKRLRVEVVNFTDVNSQSGFVSIFALSYTCLTFPTNHSRVHSMSSSIHYICFRVVVFLSNKKLQKYLTLKVPL